MQTIITSKNISIHPFINSCRNSTRFSIHNSLFCTTNKITPPSIQAPRPPRAPPQGPKFKANLKTLRIIKSDDSDDFDEEEEEEDNNHQDNEIIKNKISSSPKKSNQNQQKNNNLKQKSELNGDNENAVLENEKKGLKKDLILTRKPLMRKKGSSSVKFSKGQKPVSQKKKDRRQKETSDEGKKKKKGYTVFRRENSGTQRIEVEKRRKARQARQIKRESQVIHIYYIIEVIKLN